MKRKWTLILGVVALMIASSTLHAQEAESGKPYEDGFLKRFGVAAKVGTYGFGLDLHTSLLPNLKARVGFSYLNFNYDDPIDFSADSPVQGNPEVDGFVNEADLRFPNANLLVDFYPVKSGIFCLTAGAYIGDNKITAYGTANEPFEWDDVVINPVNGKFDAQVKVGNVVKPYFGVGLGKTISNSRVGFRFDLGVVYQGEYTIESDYSSSVINGGHKLSEDLDLPVSEDVLNLWPMISFSVSYRIK